MRTINLTPKTFNALARIPDGARVQRIWVANYKNLGIDLGLNNKSFIYKYKSPLTDKFRIIVIERFKYSQKITPNEIDSIVERYCLMRGQVREGLCPLTLKRSAINQHKADVEAAQEAKTRNTYTLTRAFDDYCRSRLFIDDIAASTQSMYSSCFNNHIVPVMGKTPLSDITSQDIYKFLDTLNDGPANLATAVLMRVQKLAIKSGKIKTPFCFNVDRRVTGQRDRTIANLPLFLKWLNTPLYRPYKCAIYAQLLYGSRANETYPLRWDEIDGDVIKIPAIRVKNRRIGLKQEHPLLLPVMPALKPILAEMEGLSQEYVFPQCSQDSPATNAVIYSLLKHSEFDLSSHDIRRTTATLLRSELNASINDIDIVLDHAVGGVNRHYLHGDDLKAKRKILSRWHHYLTIQGSDNVTLLKTS